MLDSLEGVGASITERPSSSQEHSGWLKAELVGPSVPARCTSPPGGPEFPGVSTGWVGHPGQDDFCSQATLMTSAEVRLTRKNHYTHPVYPLHL